MTDNEIIKNLTDYYKMSVNAFSKYLGLHTSQTLYDILKGRNGISKELAEIITARCLDVNPIWIKTGEGQMLKNSDATIIYNKGNSNNAVSGSGKIFKQGWMNWLIRWLN